MTHVIRTCLYTMSHCAPVYNIPLYICVQYPIVLIHISDFKWHMLSEHVHTQCPIVHPCIISHCTSAFNTPLFSSTSHHSLCSYRGFKWHMLSEQVHTQCPIVHPCTISYCTPSLYILIGHQIEFRNTTAKSPSQVLPVTFTRRII